MGSSLEYYEVSFSVSFYGLCFEVYFARYKYCYPSFFFLSVFLEYFFRPFTFSLCRSFVLESVSCRQHMCGSYFLIHSATLCLLIGALNPFTFKVIIDRYLSLPFHSLCTFVPFSLSVFLPIFKAVPLAYLVILVWWRYILSSFFCLGNSLFCLPF